MRAAKAYGRSVALIPRALISTAALAGTVAVTLPAAASAADQNLHDSCGNTRNNFGFSDSLYNALNNNGEGRVGPRRLVVNQSGRIVSRGTRLFVQRTPMDIGRATITIRKTDGRARTTVVICATEEGSAARQTRLTEFDIPRGSDRGTFTRALTGLRDRRVSVHFKGRSVSDTMAYTMTFERPNAGEVWQPTRQQLNATQRQVPVRGFADLHVHHASRWAFGGGWYHGEMDGPVAPDPAAHSQALRVNLAGIGLSTLREEHGGLTVPTWSEGSHQQLGFDDLRQAHQNGLGLIVSSGVNSQWLCALLAYARRTDRELPCHDMESAKLQILRMKRFDAAHDWYKIVTNPWEARAARLRGQLAVVLGVEVSNIFPSSDGDWERQLDELYDMGVRQVYLSHESNSRFSGTAFHHEETLKLPNQLTAWFSREIVFAHDGSGLNPVGLTSLGRDLIRAMMDRNMLIDVDHLSWEAVDDVAELTRARSYYPLYAGHTRINHLMTAAHKEVSPELNTPIRVFDYIRESGGIIGMRTGPEDMLYNDQSGVSGTCPGSVRSLIQTYRNIVDRGVPAAFGSDLNGFVTMTGPRFGPEGCPAAPASNRLDYRLTQNLPPVEGRPPSWEKYEQRGLADISTEPSVIFDMKSLGVDTTSLENSAESFIRTWTRAYQPNRQRIAPPR